MDSLTKPSREQDDSLRLSPINKTSQVNFKTSSYPLTKHRAVKHQNGDRIWFGAQHQGADGVWYSDTWPTYITAEQAQDYVRRMNTPPEPTITTVL